MLGSLIEHNSDQMDLHNIIELFQTSKNCHCHAREIVKHRCWVMKINCRIKSNLFGIWTAEIHLVAIIVGEMWDSVKSKNWLDYKNLLHFCLSVLEM